MLTKKFLVLTLFTWSCLFLFGSPSSSSNDLSLLSFVAPVDSCSNSSSSITVVVYNNGSNTVHFSQDSCVISLNASGVGSGSYSKTIKQDSIVGGDTMHIQLTASYNMSLIGVHNLFAEVDVNNESNHVNDTLRWLVPIDTATSVSITPVSNLCANSNAILLSATGTPSGGTYSYSGSGVSGAIFDPVSAGSGQHQIQVVYTDLHNCKDTSSMNIQVDTVPMVLLPPFSNVCQNSGLIRLGTGQPIGGTYSGKNVNGTLYNPQSVGIDTIVYTYIDLNNCQDSVFSAIIVDSLPIVSLGAFTAVCQFTKPDTLKGGSPIGGVYAGGQVISGVHYTDSVGIDTITYTYTDINNCSSSTVQLYTVDSTPRTSISLAHNLCQSLDTIALNFASPSGGTYVLNGDTITYYIASNLGIDTLEYYYTNSKLCSSSDTHYVRVDSVPEVQLQLPFQRTCLNAPPIVLSGGSPSGGSYASSGVIGGVYNPSSTTAGVDTIIYTYSDSNGCQSSDQQIIHLDTVPVVTLGSLARICEFEDSLQLSQGAPAGGSYSGVGVNSVNAVFNPKQAGFGIHSITYSYSDLWQCTDSAIGSIEVEKNPRIELGADTSICDQQILVLDAGVDSVDYVWSTGETTRSISIQESAIIHLSVTDTTSTLFCTTRDTIRIDYDEICLSVDEGHNYLAMQVFPNPVKDQIQLNLQRAPQSMALYTVQGKLIEQIELGDPSQRSYSLRVSEYPAGMYYLIAIYPSAKVRVMIEITP